jgi:hypothetical protein
MLGSNKRRADVLHRFHASAGEVWRAIKAAAPDSARVFALICPGPPGAAMRLTRPLRFP